ncbi:hypothetical protein D3C86_1768620 [compost metagenome]
MTNYTIDWCIKTRVDNVITNTKVCLCIINDCITNICFTSCREQHWISSNSEFNIYCNRVWTFKANVVRKALTIKNRHNRVSLTQDAHWLVFPNGLSNLTANTTKNNREEAVWKNTITICNVCVILIYSYFCNTV